jgi:hypothetical protein
MLGYAQLNFRSYLQSSYTSYPSYVLFTMMFFLLSACSQLAVSILFGSVGTYIPYFVTRHVANGNQTNIKLCHIQ